MTLRRKAIPKATRKRVVTRQHNRCANSPQNVAIGCKQYNCPLWALAERDGTFDEAGFEIDHIVEVSHGGCDEPDNLQALCPSCHRVKTRRFRTNKYLISSTDLHNGRALMECDAPAKTAKGRATRSQKRKRPE